MVLKNNSFRLVENLLNGSFTVYINECTYLLLLKLLKIHELSYFYYL